MKYILHSYTAANLIAGSITSTVTTVQSLTELARLMESMLAPVAIPDDLPSSRLQLVQYAQTHPYFSVEIVGQQLNMLEGHYEHYSTSAV